MSIDSSRLGKDGDGILSEAMAAFHADDAERLRSVLSRHPALKDMINEPIGPADAPVIIYASSREMIDVLLDAGADINGRSRWWAGGFGLLDLAPPEVASYAITRGARLDAHSTARLGLLDALRELLRQDPAVVHARGGDGQTPLHMAATVDVASLLLAAGADIDARDVDHESTPAQYMVAARQDVARLLVSRGASTDLLLAAALGDVERVTQHLSADPGRIRMRVNTDWFPMKNARAGGTIYNWTLGFHASAHEVAKKFGRVEVLQLLFEQTPPALKVLEACWLEDETAVHAFRTAAPSAATELLQEDRQLIAHAARNNRTTAVKLMLECGLPVAAPGQHRATPLHWAAFHGNTDMVREILRFNPPLEATDQDFNGTPIGWAIHGSQHGWFRASGDYARTVELLLRAGAKRPDAVSGSGEVQDVLRRNP